MQSTRLGVNPDRPRKRQILNGGDVIRETIDRIDSNSGALTLASSTLYLTSIVFFNGDIVNRIAALAANTLVKGTTGTHQWVAVYDALGNLLGQSVDEGASATWVGGAKTFELPDVAIANTDVHYLGFYQEPGTGGSPTSTTLRNCDLTSTGLSTGVHTQKVLGATFTTGAPFGATAPAVVNFSTPTSRIIYAAAWKA